MLCTSRTVASIIRHVMLGTAATLATATLATTLVSCADESQPEYWVDKLDDQAWRPRAIKRLEQFFEDAVTKANKDIKDPQVQALLNKIIDPLTKTYVEHYSDVDVKTRVALIKLVAAFRDPRAEPALKKALDEYIKRPTKSQDETDIRWVIRAQKDLKLQSLSDLILQVFMKVEAHSPLGALVIKDLQDTMMSGPAKSWAPSLRKMLQAPIPAQDKDTFPEVKNQAYWQIVSCLLLGELHDAEAVEPMMRVLLDPLKGPVHPTALLALARIGDPAVDAAIKLLKGQDKGLAEYHLAKLKKAQDLKEAPKDEPYVWMAAVVLGTSGNSKAIKPMIQVLKSQEHETNKAVILDELTKIPATAESKAAFKEGFEALKLDTRNQMGEKALPFLAEESVTRFFDPSMLDWLVSRAEETKGYPDEKKDLQVNILTTFIKLAKPNQLGKARAMMAEYGTKESKESKYKYFEEKLLAQAEAVVGACGDRVECYLSYIEKSEVQKQENEFGGIKAAYMIGSLGDENAAMELVDRLESLENKSVLMAALKAIDYLLPKGSAKVAQKLDEILEAHRKSADQHRMEADHAIRQYMYRIRARAAG
jgi:HEAT repeat protein